MNQTGNNYLASVGRKFHEVICAESYNSLRYYKVYTKIKRDYPLCLQYMQQIQLLLPSQTS